MTLILPVLLGCSSVLQIEKLERVCIAYQFHRTHEEVSQSEDELKSMQDEKDKYVPSAKPLSCWRP